MRRPCRKERLTISAFYQQATTDQYGRFTFTCAVPGEYKVCAWEDVDSTAWLDPEFMKPLASKGSVTVGESAQASVQVNLIPAESAPESLARLAELTGRRKSNLSRTLKTMERYGFVRLSHGPRGSVIPRVPYQKISLTLPLSRTGLQGTEAA